MYPQAGLGLNITETIAGLCDIRTLKGETV
jgi:hypothetical protein